MSVENLDMVLEGLVTGGRTSQRIREFNAIADNFLKATYPYDSTLTPSEFHRAIAAGERHFLAWGWGVDPWDVVLDMTVCD